MKITITKDENCTIVAIVGRVDTTNAKDFEAVVATILREECVNIIVDCEKMSYVSSSALRIFLILQKGVNAKQGNLELRAMGGPLKEVFRITGFSTIFNIE